jgi:16S rRNA (guanine527-N7)-methyltransferase
VSEDSDIDLVQLLRADATALGIDLSVHQATTLATQRDLVYRRNTALNLTRVPIEEAGTLHIADSLSGLSFMLLGPEGPWADIGSGAGYPGIPLAVASGRHVDLLESVGKKADFLQQTVAALCLDITVRKCRAEEAASATPSLYAAVAARAVSSLPALVELAAPLLKVGGVLVCWKSRPELSEYEHGRKAASLVGMRELERAAARLPRSDATRTLVVYERFGPPKIRLPRAVGLAQRRPLA